MRRGHEPYQTRPPPPPSSGFFYSRSGAPSPSHSHRSFAEMPQHRSRRSMEPPVDEVTPSYYVEHLATFAVGRQFGLVFPQDGIRKLRKLEKNSAIYAQPLVLRLKPQELTVEDENGELVERFNMELVDSPTPYVSNNHRDMYNNILLFIVKDDPRDRTTGNRVTEMHIFQCNRVAATEVAQDIKAYMDKHYHGVRNGRRSTGPMQQQQMMPQALAQYPADDASISSDSSEVFERDVNTLNRCFDDIERFVARVQSAAIAQKELEQQAHRYRTAQRNKDKRPSHPDPNGILQMRAQLPMENEFVDVLRKFKLSFNLLAKLKSHIHEPNAPELLHFLFSPLKIILNASHWGLGRNIAPQVVAPLLSLEARELLQNCLTSQESDLWISLGEAWRTPPEDWPGQLPPPYRPVFMDGFAPYGLPDQMRTSGFPAPLHRGESAPPAQYRQPPPRDRSVDTAPNTPLASRSRQQRPQRNMSVDNLDLDRLSLERERMDFERAKMIERERRLLDEERRLREERARVEAERNLLKHENTSTLQHNGRPRNNYEAPPSSQASPAPARALPPAARPNLPDLDAQSPRQRAFVDDVVNRGGKLVMATFDRVAQNQKELTVSRGEYLEVLEDSKNWWECRNVHQRVGYVPHTILSVVPMQDNRDIYGQPMRQQPPAISHQQLNGHASSSGPISPKATYSDAGVQANVQQVIRAPSPQPQPVAPQPTYHPPQPTYQLPPQQMYHSPQPTYQQPQPTYQTPAPAPVPTKTMIDRLREQQLSHVSPVPQPPPARQPTSKPSMVVITRSQEEQQVINELSNTVVNKNEMLKPNREIHTSTIQINEGSSTRDVARWLEEKGFSYRVLDLFDGQDGAALFSLNKNHLIQACGRDEGSRLYSQILVQKNRSNYQTRTNAELKAILKMRKTHVEVTNTAPDEEPPMAVA